MNDIDLIHAKNKLEILILKSEIISIKLQSIDAYKETARLKKEVKKIL